MKLYEYIDKETGKLVTVHAPDPDMPCCEVSDAAEPGGGHYCWDPYKSLQRIAGRYNIRFDNEVVDEQGNLHRYYHTTRYGAKAVEVVLRKKDKKSLKSTGYYILGITVIRSRKVADRVIKYKGYPECYGAAPVRCRLTGLKLNKAPLFPKPKPAPEPPRARAGKRIGE